MLAKFSKPITMRSKKLDFQTLGCVCPCTDKGYIYNTVLYYVI